MTTKSSFFLLRHTDAGDACHLWKASVISSVAALPLEMTVCAPAQSFTRQWNIYWGPGTALCGDDNGGNKRQTSLSSWRSHSGISYIRWWEKLRGNEAEVGFRERQGENGELEFRWSGPGRRKWHPKKALEGVTGISSPPPGHSALFPSPLPGTLA